MEEVFIVYKTDNHHSYKSRDIIGIATSQEEAIGLCIQQSINDGTKIDEEQQFNLRNIKQTQGYKADGEFQYEEVTTNNLL